MHCTVRRVNMQNSKTLKYLNLKVYDTKTKHDFIHEYALMFHHSSSFFLSSF